MYEFPNIPSVYTRISQYQRFIVNAIQGNIAPAEYLEEDVPEIPTSEVKYWSDSSSHSSGFSSSNSDSCSID